MAQVLFMGKEVYTSGPIPQLGSKLPQTTICTPRLEDIFINELPGPLLLNIFPSVDTSVCAKSLKTFSQECASLTGLQLFHISYDLPFALDRFLKENKIEAAVGSCFRSDLSEKLGLKICSGPLRGLCARCVILVDREMTVRYIELVSEITNEPNYQQAIHQAIDLC